MSVLEKAVLDLANALETLEAKIESKQDDNTVNNDDLIAAREKAGAARQHAEKAGETLTGAIGDLKTLLDTHQADAES